MRSRVLPQSCQPAPAIARGATLLEVLVTVVATSIGLLGLAGLLQLSARSNRAALEATEVDLAARSLIEAMHAAVASGASGAATEVDRQRLAQMLAGVPDAHITLACAGATAPVCHLRIDWAQPDAAAPGRRTALAFVFVP